MPAERPSLPLAAAVCALAVATLFLLPSAQATHYRAGAVSWTTAADAMSVSHGEIAIQPALGLRAELAVRCTQYAGCGTALPGADLCATNGGPGCLGPISWGDGESTSDYSAIVTRSDPASDAVFVRLTQAGTQEDIVHVYGAVASGGSDVLAYALGGAGLAGTALAAILVYRSRRGSPGSRDPVGAWMPEERIGRYRIEKPLGAGSYGLTYLAEDHKGRRFVLKRPRAGAGDAAPAMLAEMAALRRVASPRIVRLVETLRSPEGPVLVLDYLPGGSLHARLALGPLGEREAAAMARDVLLALHDLHAAGLVHRDVKPANILFDAEGRACLADLGSTDEATGSLVDATARTGGEGSLRYMAPEQVALGHADARSDLYAAGIVLAEALSHHPVRGATGPEARKAILQGHLALPKGGALQDLVRRATARDPGRRFQSAREMLQALEASPIAGTPAGSGPLPPRPRPAGSPGPRAAAGSS